MLITGKSTFFSFFLFVLSGFFYFLDFYLLINLFIEFPVYFISGFLFIYLFIAIPDFYFIFLLLNFQLFIYLFYFYC